nr:inositol monophosphatase family protein [Stakelama pacifica]
MMHDLYEPVSALIREVSETIILPRFRNLSAGEKEEKSPDDWVTIADRESEARLSEGLAALLPEARVIGEEACAADPAILEQVGTGLQWIIDPVDGTGNFAAGRAPFGVMVALGDGDRVAAGWIYDPLNQRMCHAMRGGGAYINEERVMARRSDGPLPVAGLATYFMPPDQCQIITARASGKFEIVDIPRCAAEQYPRLVLGQNDVTIFERTLPWDHAAGTLFLTEAGGRIARLDGSPYRLGDARTGMIAASSPQIWDEAMRSLLG